MEGDKDGGEVGLISRAAAEEEEEEEEPIVDDAKSQAKRAKIDAVWQVCVCVCVCARVYEGLYVHTPLSPGPRTCTPVLVCSEIRSQGYPTSQPACGKGTVIPPPCGLVTPHIPTLAGTQQP